MSFHLDRQSRSSFPLQVVRQATAQLVAGRLHPGDRLPSVRQLARDLGISRTTAERIHEALCESMLAEVRPRSGAFVAHADMEPRKTEEIQVIYEFLKLTVSRGLALGLTPARLVQLLRALTEAGLPGEGRTVFPIIATRDFFDCMCHCLGEGFPARLVHLPPEERDARIPPGTRYLLSTYYMRARAKRIAEAHRCSLLYVRYNVQLLEEAMSMPTGEHRVFVTRDRDNAETTKVFLASAFPEVAAHRYSVTPVQKWLEDPFASSGKGQVWATITAESFLRNRTSADRVRLLHPLLAQDFIDELQCLALLG